MNQVLADFCRLEQEFEQYNVSLQVICADADDPSLASRFHPPATVTLLWDLDRKLSLQYGACQEQTGAIEQLDYKPLTVVLDDASRVLRIFPVQAPEQHVQQVLQFVKELPAFKSARPANWQAPVLLIPNVFNAEFCRHLIRLYEADGGRDSGFMKPVGDKFAEVVDPDFKQRRDLTLTDLVTLSQVNDVILRRVKPEIEKAFQFSITNFERYVVACYDSKNQGFFKLHRDNVTPGTTHRRFAMTLNLNTGYEGGYLRFPEYGPYLYRPSLGDAIVFSCGLLHEATPVTSDRRFALLSFFYSDAETQLRQEGQKQIVFDRPQQGVTETIPTVDNKRITKSSAGFQPKPKRKS